MDKRVNWLAFHRDYLRMTGTPLKSFPLAVFNLLLRHNVRLRGSIDSERQRLGSFQLLANMECIGFTENMAVSLVRGQP